MSSVLKISESDPYTYGNSIDFCGKVGYNGKRKVFGLKETYIAPEMEIVEFETEDVITTSSYNPNDPDVDVGQG